MNHLISIDAKKTAAFVNEPEVSAYADLFLRNNGFSIKHEKTGNSKIDKCWPSKTSAAQGCGLPDLLVYLSADAPLPFCVWENKAPQYAIKIALDEAKFYIEGVHSKLAGQPGLPRLAAGFNGKQLKLAYFNHESQWVDLKVGGKALSNEFPGPEHAANGVSSNGTFNAAAGMIRQSDLRSALPKLKTLYRSIPALSSGRRPIDFTVALLTLKMLLENEPVQWGTWAEQPALVADADDTDQAVYERLKQLADRVLATPKYKSKYGDIFDFKEKMPSKDDIAFNFVDALKAIPRDQGFFERLFDIIDHLPPLHGADFDIFGEVYQSIGDDATKRALGEFFTGRHIISAVVPVLLHRAGIKSFSQHLEGKSIADIACGTGGFLTEALRHIRKQFALDEEATKKFAERAFHGYDLSHSNASRARVNMYFAGDGFSDIAGGWDSLGATPNRKGFGPFDFILTNPPYGTSATYNRLEESFVRRAIDLLKPGAGWGLVVIPTGILENPRSAPFRMEFLRRAVITDLISLPTHAFAPYTKQRTCIAIFQRRATDLEADSWVDLLEEIRDEEIAMFIVDNDGFANSDKRYPTSRQSKDGSWLHDDLASWIDQKGKQQPGKLFNALISKRPPGTCENEFGEVLASKYRLMSVAELNEMSSERKAIAGDGLELLPDIYLRPTFGLMEYSEFVAAAEALLNDVRSKAATGNGPIRERAKTLLATRVYFKDDAKKAHSSIEDMFDVEKGGQGLTEADIYRQFDPQGVPVYGGGEGLPKFFMSPGSVNKKGRAVAIYTGPALIVSMDGCSGVVRYIGAERFSCNHHAAVLKPKKKLKHAPEYVAQQVEGGLRGLASNRDGSSTLTLPALKRFRYLEPPSTSVMKRISQLRAELAYTRDKFA